ncbi:hypothetical protein HK096_002707 [Nowakowskiella sp. JEL0078]|nr:hypothetical protein HK096_002707 [Nowakowskiella sp. JEL0078]
MSQIRIAFQRAALQNQIGVGLRPSEASLASQLQESFFPKDAISQTADAAVKALNDAQEFLAEISNFSSQKFSSAETDAFSPWNSKLDSEKRRSALLSLLRKILKPQDSNANISTFTPKWTLGFRVPILAAQQQIANLTTQNDPTPTSNLETSLHPIVPCVGALAIPLTPLASAMSAFREGALTASQVSPSQVSSSLSILRNALANAKDLIVNHWAQFGAAAAVIVALYAAYIYLVDSKVFENVMLDSVNTTLRDRLIGHKTEVEALAEMLASEKVSELMAEVNGLRDTISILNSSQVANNVNVISANSSVSEVEQPRSVEANTMLFESAWKLEREAMLAQIDKLEQDNIKLASTLKEFELSKTGNFEDQVYVNMDPAESKRLHELEAHNTLLLTQLEELTNVRTEQENVIQSLLVENTRRDFEIERLGGENLAQKDMIQSLQQEMRSEKMDQQDRFRKMEEEIMVRSESASSIQDIENNNTTSQLISPDAPAILQLEDHLENSSFDDWDKLSNFLNAIESLKTPLTRNKN